MDRDLATRCFNENFNRFGQQFEQGNLYLGLKNMALMLKTLLSKVENLEREVQFLKQGR